MVRAVLTVPRPLLGFMPFIDWALPAVALGAVGAIMLAWRIGMQRLATWEAS